MAARGGDPVVTAQQDALAPVRNALLTRAGTEAERELAAARHDADAALAKARAEARRILDEAAEEGRTDSAASIAAEYEKARRAARSLELAAQREVYDELRRQVTTEVSHAFADAGERLAVTVRAELGPGATLRDVPGGGVVGEVAGRLVDLSVRAVADRAVDALGDEVRELWAP